MADSTSPGTGGPVPSAPPAYGGPVPSAPPAYGAYPPGGPQPYGAPVPSAPPAYGAPPPSAPPAYGAYGPAYGPTGYGQQYGAPGHPRPMPAFFGGDWGGAFLVNAIGIGAMLAISLLSGLLNSATTDFPIEGSEFIATVFLFVAMAAGASVGAQGFGVEFDLGFRPLTITLVGYGLLAFYFLRRLRQTGQPTPATFGLQVGRVAVVHAGAMLLIALLSGVGGEFTPSADVLSTIVNAMVSLAIALVVVSVIGLPNLFPGRYEYYRAMLAAPVRAMLFLTVVTSAVTLVALIVLLAVADTGPNPFGAAAPRGSGGDIVLDLLQVVLTLLPNLAGYALLFAIGVPIKGAASLGGFGSSSGSVSIFDATDAYSAYWLMPIVALALLVVTGWISARRSPLAANGRPVGWWLAAVMPVAFFVLALGLDISATLGGGFGGSGEVGFDLLFVVLLGAVYGIGAGMLGTLMVPRSAPAMGYGVPAGHPSMGPVPPPMVPPPGYGEPASGSLPPGYAAPRPGYGPPSYPPPPVTASSAPAPQPAPAPEPPTMPPAAAVPSPSAEPSANPVPSQASADPPSAAPLLPPPAEPVPPAQANPPAPPSVWDRDRPS